MNIFKNKNFLLLTIVRLIINFADSLFYIVSIWYTSKVLGSVFYTSVASFLFLVPETLLIFIGPIIDRFNPKKILIISLASQLILLLILSLMFSQINIIVLLIIVFLSSFMSTITYPIEDTIIPQIVDTEQLVAANSILSISYQVFDSIFNGISGFMLVAFSTAALYRINFFAFLLPLLIVFLIKFVYKRSNETYNFAEYWTDLKGGAKFIKNSPLLYVLTPLIFVNLFNSLNSVVMPFFAQEYKNSSEAFGFILAIKGVGGICGSLFINYIKKILPTGKLLSLLLTLNSVFWLVFLFAGGSFISYIFLFISYMFFGMYNIIYYSFIQSITPINLMGRVSTTVDTIITIAMPIGSILGGWILKLLPTNYCMMFSAIFTILTAIFYMKSKVVNNIPHIDKIKRIEESY